MKDDFDPRKAADKKNPKILNREVYYKGQTIIRQGDEAFRAYFIEKGRVEVLVNEGHHMLKVAELHPGDIFGEMALIENGLRSASVRALDDVTVTVISRDEIERKIQSIDDKAMRALIYVIISRLREANISQLYHYKNLADFQDRVCGLVHRVAVGIDQKERDSFRSEVMPMLDNLQTVLEKYQPKRK